MGEMNWVNKKIHLYNVTMGLYMLDWWERCLFTITSFVRLIIGMFPPLTRVDIMLLVLLCFICLNGSRFAIDIYESHLKAPIMHGGNYGMGIGMPST